MAFEYLPIMAQNSAPKPPRVLVKPSNFAWCAVTKPLFQSRVALLTSAALRVESQPPFVPREDLSYRRVPSDPAIGPIVIDHHSGIGAVPKQDPEIVFPRTALASLLSRGLLGSLSAALFVYGRCAQTRTGGKGACASACLRIDAGRGRPSTARTLLTFLP